MDIEDQKVMALEGVHIWGRGVLAQVDRIDAARQAMAVRPSVPEGFYSARRNFQVDRHLFLIASHQLIEHIEWLLELKMVGPNAVANVLRFRESVKDLRDKNEHVVDYFLGRGHRPDTWMHDGSADASATQGTKIGGRLDWHEVASAVKSLMASLPPYYLPKPD